VSVFGYAGLAAPTCPANLSARSLGDGGSEATAEALAKARRSMAIKAIRLGPQAVESGQITAKYPVVIGRLCAWTIFQREAAVSRLRTQGKQP